MEKKGLYGSLAGFTASVTLQPLENIKMMVLVPPKELDLTKNFLNNVVRATKFLYKDDGYRAFYRGLTANALRTAFSSSIFFPILRICEENFRQLDKSGESKLVPFLSSTIARIASVFISNPLSVIETRFQYGGHERWHGGIGSSLNKIYQVEGIQGFWKGGLATTYKEGLFAGAFYSLYQEGKQFGLNPFVAGMLAGMISTSFTHPLQIVRAEIQILELTNSKSSGSIGNHLRTLFKTGEAFRGLAPRVIKKPLTNTLAFLAFEAMETHGTTE